MRNERAFTYYWVVLIGVVVFFNFTSPILPRNYKNYIFLFGGLISLITFGRGRFSPPIWAIWSSLVFLVLATINQHHQWSPTIVYQFAFMAVGFGVLFQLYSFWNERVKDILYTALGLFCLLQCVWIFINWAGYDPVSFITGAKILLIKTRKAPEVYPIIGSMGHWMVSGSFLIMTLPFMLNLSKYLILPALMAAYLLPSGLPPVGIGLMLGFCLMVKFGKRWWFWLVGLSATVISYVILEPYGVFEPSERLKIWEYATLRFKVNSFYGEGLGYFRDLFSLVFKGQFVELHRHPHNEFVSTYVSFGMIGLAILCYWLYICLKSFNLDRIACLSMVGSIAPMLFGFPLHVAGTAIVMIISLASILSKRENICT